MSLKERSRLANTAPGPLLKDYFLSFPVKRKIKPNSPLNVVDFCPRKGWQYSSETQLKDLNQNSSCLTGLRLLWLNTCTPSQCCFSHSACLISGDAVDENHENRREDWDK